MQQPVACSAAGCCIADPKLAELLVVDPVGQPKTVTATPPAIFVTRAFASSSPRCFPIEFKRSLSAGQTRHARARRDVGGAQRLQPLVRFTSMPRRSSGVGAEQPPCSLGEQLACCILAGEQGVDRGEQVEEVDRL